MILYFGWEVWREIWNDFLNYLCIIGVSPADRGQEFWDNSDWAVTYSLRFSHLMDTKPPILKRSTLFGSIKK